MSRVLMGILEKGYRDTQKNAMSLRMIYGTRAPIKFFQTTLMMSSCIEKEDRGRL
jgi:hypothetical protein